MGKRFNDNLPLVSIIIPCYNEEKFIGKCIESAFEQSYPKDKIEILIIDGMSEDNTKEIVKKYMGQYSFVRLLENPRRITPVAFNIGIKNAAGSIVMIMGAHAEYEKDYVSKCVACLDEYEADNVGGTIKTLSDQDTFAGKIIVDVLGSCFGVGNSDYKINLKNVKFVDTVFGGCYRKEVFEKIGYFNEQLTKSQDIEFNIRLKKAGGKIVFDPDIECHYYVRTNFFYFLKHNFTNGVWAILPFKYTNIMPVSLRHLVPLGFVLWLLIFGIFSLFTTVGAFIFVLTIGMYSLVNFYFSVRVAIKKKDFKILFLLPFIFFTLHFSYGIGSVWGMIKCLLSVSFWKNRFSLRS